MSRYFFIIFLYCYAEINLAAAKDWQCEKNVTGEWACVTESPIEQSKSSVTPKIIPAPQPEPDVTQPNPSVTVESNTTPIALQPPLSNYQQMQQEGWTCAPNAENSTWDCHLVGVNPSGETKIIADENALSLRLIKPAFTLKQERGFKKMQKEFPFDPWQQCSAPQKNKQKLISQKKMREIKPLEIESDYSEVFDREISSFSGNVDIKRADQHLSADKASYDSVADVMDTQGNVYYSEDGIALSSGSATLKLAADKAILRNVLFESLSGPYRGSADIAYKDSKDLTRYHEAAYTSCRPGNQDWVIHSSRLKINKDSGEGSATQAWLEFKGIPVLYTPYISFPVDDRRASGFLPPTWGSTARSGFQLGSPFYWNIAPNYDAVLKPRYLGKRGLLLGADFRYLTEMSKGSIGVEILPYDDIRNTTRYLGSFKNSTTFLPNLTASADLNYVSDSNYLYELGNALSFTDSRYVNSRASLNYNLPDLNFLAQFERYQTIDNTIPNSQRPYQKIPQINLDLNHSFESMPLDLAMNNEFVYFYRTGRISGQRFNSKPSITLPFNYKGIFATPKLSLQHTQYVLANQIPGSETSVNRTNSIASLDTGAFLEQELQIGNNTLLHTLEPRVFYLYAPYNNQDNIPIFDSALYDFTFASLFRENRFSGSDRVQDANQVSLALTSRLLDSTSGLEYLKLAVGQQIFFKNRTVTLPGYTPATNHLSNFITELSGNFNQQLSFSAGMQWNPYTHDFPRRSIRLQLMNQPNQIINIGYLYRKDQVGQTVPIGQIDPLTRQPLLTGETTSISQTDVSFRWPIYDDWHLMGRWLYALNFNATKEGFIGVEKDSCCWRFSVIGRRFTNALSNTIDAKLQTGIFVQLELKGLGRFGDNINQFLERNIPGYIDTH